MELSEKAMNKMMDIGNNKQNNALAKKSDPLLEIPPDIDTGDVLLEMNKYYQMKHAGKGTKEWKLINGNFIQVD